MLLGFQADLGGISDEIKHLQVWYAWCNREPNISSIMPPRVLYWSERHRLKAAMFLLMRAIFHHFFGQFSLIIFAQLVVAYRSTSHYSHIERKRICGAFVHSTTGYALDHTLLGSLSDSYLTLGSKWGRAGILRMGIFKSQSLVSCCWFGEQIWRLSDMLRIHWSNASTLTPSTCTRIPAGIAIINYNCNLIALLQQLAVWSLQSTQPL